MSLARPRSTALHGPGRITAQYQSVSGAVDTSTTPYVGYAYSGPSDGSLLTSMTYPNGRVLNDNYTGGNANGNPWPAKHTPPLKSGDDPMNVYPRDPGAPDPHNIPGPDGLTDYQRWGSQGTRARQARK